MGDFRSYMRAAVSESRNTLMLSEKIASRGDLRKKNVFNDNGGRDRIPKDRGLFRHSSQAERLIISQRELRKRKERKRKTYFTHTD